MDFSLIIGILAGFGIIGFGIMDGGVLSGFIDPASMAITFGGTFAATFVSFPVSFFKAIPAQLNIVLHKNKYDPHSYIDNIILFAQEARKKGLLSMEERALKEKDAFLRNGMMLLVDGIDPTKVKDMLENELDYLEDRHARATHFYDRAAAFALAFGMLGTVIGLINMLANLNMESADASALLGKGMSLALLTTFYGSLLANLVLTPLANRLRMRHDEEMLCKEMVVNGVVAIQSGENPRHIEERLRGFLAEKDKKTFKNKKDAAPPPSRVVRRTRR